MNVLHANLMQTWKKDTETFEHFLLHCPYYQNICEEYLPKCILPNPEISTILDNEKQVILSILDPVSSKLPLTVKNGWSSVKAAYDVSRKFCYDMHRKRDKFYTNLDKDNKWNNPVISNYSIKLNC